MRNDSRPTFAGSPASPLGGADERPIESERPDSRDSVAHGRESHVMHEESEQNAPDAPDDPVTPSSDASPNARI